MSYFSGPGQGWQVPSSHGSKTYYGGSPKPSSVSQSSGFFEEVLDGILAVVQVVAVLAVLAGAGFLALVVFGG